MAVASMSSMLNISAEILPHSDVSYVAFRLAFFDTLERIALADQFGGGGERQFGFLTEVPFLKSVAPQVQLDLLLETWTRHLSPVPFDATLVDESIIYAACETGARIVSRDSAAARRFLKRGPRELPFPIDGVLAERLQALHLNLANEGDFLLISQFQDMPPLEAARLKDKYGLRPSACEPMFDALGRWRVSPAFFDNTPGLLTPQEASRTSALLKIPMPRTVA